MIGKNLRYVFLNEFVLLQVHLMFDDVLNILVIDDKSLIQFLFFVYQNDSLILVNHLHHLNLFLYQIFQY